jgi:hypothetical protein
MNSTTINARCFSEKVINACMNHFFDCRRV